MHPKQIKVRELCHPEQSEGSSWVTASGQQTGSFALLSMTIRGKCLWRHFAFSLVEVILAVGIFAVAVTVILALLPALARQGGSSADGLVASRLPDAVTVELQRVAVAGGFDALAAQARPMSAPLPATLQLLASHEGDRIQSLDYLPSLVAEPIAETEQYFLIEAWQFNQPGLAFDPGGTGLALHVRVSWPYRNPGAVEATPFSERDFVTFCVVINR